MQWKTAMPVNNSYRMVKKFAFLPIHDSASTVIYWLETVWVCQRYAIYDKPVSNYWRTVLVTNDYAEAKTDGPGY